MWNKLTKQDDTSQAYPAIIVFIHDQTLWGYMVKR